MYGAGIRFEQNTADFDISVSSPLSPKIVSEAGVSAGVASKAAESRKHEYNDTKCSEYGWQCFPLAKHTPTSIHGINVNMQHTKIMPIQS